MALDIIAKISEHVGGIARTSGSSPATCKRPPRQMERLATVRLWIFGPTNMREPKWQTAAQARRAITRIASDRLIEKSQRLANCFADATDSQRPQIQIIGDQVVGRPAGRSRISAACNAGSITPATLDATLS